MHANSRLHAFLSSPEGRRCWVTKKMKGQVTLTHTFLDGFFTGKLCVPPCLKEAFDNAIAQDVRNGTQMCVNELRTAVFPFFCDFDIHLVPGAEERCDALIVSGVVVRQVHAFVAEREKLFCVVATTPDRPSPRPDKSTKRGIHIYVPHVLVSHEEALLMRESIVAALDREIPNVTDWADAFDNNPFSNESGGLRMIGAPKATKCEECNGKNSAQCVACMGSGNILNNEQSYTFRACLDKTGSLDARLTRKLTENVDALVRCATVRSSQLSTSEDWQCTPGCPEFMPLRDRTRGPPLAGNKRRTFQEDAVSPRIIKWPRQYVTDPAKIDAIRQVFRTRFSDVYKNIDVAEVSRAARKNVLFVKLTGEGESYCLNIQGRHRSNRIYGVIEHGFAMLKCHCVRRFHGAHSRIVQKLCI